MSTKQRTDRPWSVRGIEPEAQAAAKIAAERAGMTIGAWVTRALHERAAQELTGTTVGPTLEKTIEQLAEQVAEANRRMADQTAKAAENLSSVQTEGCLNFPALHEASVQPSAPSSFAVHGGHAVT